MEPNELPDDGKGGGQVENEAHPVSIQKSGLVFLIVLFSDRRGP